MSLSDLEAVVVAPRHPLTPPEPAGEGPVTLFRVMQTMIGEGLKERYKPPPKLSHELFVLLMQLNEEERRSQNRAHNAKQAAGRKSA
jgi:hypothetical protein